MTHLRLLGGIHIPEAYYPALERISVTFNIVPEDVGDQGVYLAEVLRTPRDPDDPTRVWWHNTDVIGESWTSVNPGEYRRTPPEPPCIIREVPVGSPSVAQRTILEEAIQTCRGLPARSMVEDSILRRATNLLGRSVDGARAGLRREVCNAHHIKDRASYQSLIDRLYSGYFEELALPVNEFTSTILLVQLQAIANAWIEQDWSSDPSGYLDAYVASLLRDRDTARIVMQVLEYEYDAGQDHVRQALAGSMVAMPRQLMFAWHRFLGAFMISKIVESNNLKLAVDPIVVEEAGVCTITGLRIGANFFLDRPDEWALGRIEDGDLSHKTLKQRARASSSEIHPIFTRLFSDMISAQAMTLSEDRRIVEAGVSELRSLQESTDPLTCELESAWADHALLKAYKFLGDHAKTAQYANMIAARMIMRRALQSGDTS
jgi:hypothetical protein